MRKRQMKNMILITLITLSIWQTGKLWLGNMSGLSFFVQSKETAVRQIEPKSIWLVPGAPGTLVYRLGEGNREYQSVRDEIEMNIKTYLKGAKAKEAVDLNWEEIFQKRGILYEYPMPITYGEMIGKSNKPAPKDKSMVNDIDYIFVQLVDDYRGLAKWQLISSKENKSIDIEIQAQFDNMTAFNDLLNDQTLKYKVKYQPTFNMVGISNKNLFLPIASKDTPIVYDVLEWNNPLDGADGLNKFDPYVNSYFRNPLLKKEEMTSDGVYIFSELMRAVVKYYPSGVFEYANIGVTEVKNKIPRLEAYNIAKQFLKQNESMSKEIRNTLFLSDVEEMDTGYTFYFDMRVGGIPIYFSQAERNRLGMDHMAQVTVEGQGVSKFKWNASELKPKTIGDNDKVKTGYFNMKYTDGINKVLEHVANENNLSSLIIDDMRWVYMIDGANEDIKLRWIMLHEDKWYSP